MHASASFPLALVMAAGRGNRLLPLTHDRPKCLLEVGGQSILEHQLAALRAAGIHRIQIVTGHGDSLVRRCAGAEDNGLSYSLNDQFATTSSLFSLGCVTQRPGPEGVLILNSDVLFHPLLLRRLIDDPRPNVLLADFTGTLGEEEMKICVDGDYRITAISKALDPATAQAENLGVLKVGREAAEAMLALARTPGGIEGLSWIPDAIHHLRDLHPFHALPTGGLPWIEIDYHHDLRRARQTVWPHIAAATL